MKVPERLTTKRLELSLFKEEDFSEFFQIISNEYCTRYISKKSDSISLEEAKTLFSLILSYYNHPNSVFALKISPKDNDTCIGTCGLYFSRNNSPIECFYSLLPAYQGNGFAIEAMVKLLGYTFDMLNLPKIRILLHPNNSESWKVAERIGMKYMGHMKHDIITPKAMLFTINKEEYFAQRIY